MGMQLAIQTEANLLKVVATGKFSLAQAKRTFLEMLEAVALSHSEKVLFDGREISGKPETMERFYYGKFAAESVATFKERGLCVRFAYVLREPVLDPARFGEIAAVNRGLRVKMFESPAEALQWLDNGASQQAKRK